MRLALLTYLLVSLSVLAGPAWAQFSSVRIQLIDVGQGNGILIRTPNQRWILLDAGLQTPPCAPGSLISVPGNVWQ